MKTIIPALLSVGFGVAALVNALIGNVVEFFVLGVIAIICVLGVASGMQQEIDKIHGGTG